MKARRNLAEKHRPVCWGESAQIFKMTYRQEKAARIVLEKPVEARKTKTPSPPRDFPKCFSYFAKSFREEPWGSLRGILQQTFPPLEPRVLPSFPYQPISYPRPSPRGRKPARAEESRRRSFNCAAWKYKIDLILGRLPGPEI